MRSHYVPRMYLKGWSTIHENRQGQICVYEKGEIPTFKSIRRQVAWRENYYIEETEKMFARDVEGKTDPILQKLIAEQKLTEPERDQLARFMFLLWQRVPFNLEGLFRQIRQITKPSMINDLQKMFKDFDLPEQVFDAQNFETSEHEKALYSELMMRDTYQQYRAFARMNWRIFKAAPGKEFVTSDNPVFFDRRFGLSDFMFSYFIFPVSKDLLLKGKLSRISGKDFEPITEDETLRLNREVIRNCDREIYGSRTDAEIVKIVNDCAGDARSVKHKINMKFE